MNNEGNNGSQIGVVSIVVGVAALGILIVVSLGFFSDKISAMF